MVQQVGCVVGLPVRWVAIPYVIGCGRFDAVGCKRIMVGMGLSANKAAKARDGDNQKTAANKQQPQCLGGTEASTACYTYHMVHTLQNL